MREPLELLWQLVTTSIGVGAATMALLQFAKDLLPLRLWLQQPYLRGWLKRQMKAAEPILEEWQRSSENKKMLKEVSQQLLRLATGGHRSALYNLPVERLAGQLNVAAQIALEYPTKHKLLLAALAGGAESSDLNRVLESTPQFRTEGQPSTDQIDWVDARNRVAHQIQRNLDALQIEMVRRWRLFMQLCAIGISTGLMLVAALLLYPRGTWQGMTPKGEAIDIAVVSVLGGLLGGFFARIARDLLAAIEAVRSGPR